MAPAISQLQGLEVRHSPSPSAASDLLACAAPPQATPTAASARPAPSAAALAPSSRSLLDHTPKSSFSVAEDAAGGGSSTAAAAAAAVAAAGSVSGASAGQLQHAVSAALQELRSSSDADFVSQALALSKMAASAAGGYSTAANPCSTSGTGSGGFIAAGKVSSTSRDSQLASVNLEGPDLFELAAAAAGPEGHQLSIAAGMSAGSAALESLEQLAAAMNGILDDRP